MTKIIVCKKVGFDCEGVVRAETDEEVLRLAAEHARSAHGVEEITPEVLEKVKMAIQDA